MSKYESIRPKGTRVKKEHTIHTPYGKIEYTVGSGFVSSTAHLDRPQKLTAAEDTTLKVMTAMPNEYVGGAVLHAIFNNEEELGTTSSEALAARMLRLKDKLGDTKGEVIRYRREQYALVAPSKLREKLIYKDGEVVFPDGERDRLSKSNNLIMQKLLEKPGSRVTSKELSRMYAQSKGVREKPEAARIHIYAIRQQLHDTKIILHDRGYYIDPEAKEKEKIYSFGGSSFSPTERKITHADGDERRLPPKISFLLEVLLQNPQNKYKKSDLVELFSNRNQKFYAMDILRLKRELEDPAMLKSEKGLLWLDLPSQRKSTG